ncbi:hypothetical protein L202_05389 [Cryptococcus amylolentus CBS 6039]|uniref:Translocation protein SEC66 n=2 Tax=Cryptococcus amylolentus TaxID=104669 RepID=A0A1E3HKC1_9TREE|nr:hypothetical protein L202_05389 [Cryptococcus amylolentus CBS 6039]ODN76788.1 hypothetical protein L202_05389 [Cryptococcus amylolentus CBS 6039]ODO04710.1 hypothetical protein I350_05319 [Cryptococcus amylolentus CBS 6273]
MATSLLAPVAYISVLVTAMAIFSRIYRRRKAVAKTSFTPYFPTHPARDIYVSLLSNSPSTPDNLLKSALLARAIVDIQRLAQLRDDKMALNNLHTRGLIGDDTMARFAAAEKELEAEVLDVVSEANSFKQGWGQFIFGTASEAAQAEKTRNTVMNMHVIRQMEEKRLERRSKYLNLSSTAQLPATPNAPAVITPEASTPSPQALPEVPQEAPVANQATATASEGVASPNGKASVGKKKGKKK